MIKSICLTLIVGCISIIFVRASQHQEQGEWQHIVLNDVFFSELSTTSSCSHNEVFRSPQCWMEPFERIIYGFGDNGGKNSLQLASSSICDEMTDVQRSLLAIELTRCFTIQSNCDLPEKCNTWIKDEIGAKKCLREMPDSAYGVYNAHYHKIYDICLHLSQETWFFDAPLRFASNLETAVERQGD